jgi:AraC-like DNA-binding protein
LDGRIGTARPRASNAVLVRWRMQLAASLLAGGGANVAAVAFETGYASEAAFSRAFKRELGVPPVEWRRRAAG